MIKNNVKKLEKIEEFRW